MGYMIGSFDNQDGPKSQSPSDGAHHSGGAPMKEKSSVLDQDIAQTYNQYKTFEGRRYTGMKVGGRHKWYYEQGEWKEVKVAPDRWEFTYAVPKRRAGHAPPGSGVPVDTE